MANIYQTPESKLSESNDEGFKLYKVSGVGVATFMGSFMAGGFLISQNYKRLGDHDKASKALQYSVLATVVLITCIFLIPDDVYIPNSVFTIPQIVVMVYLAKAYQAKDIEEHIEKGGLMYSNWKAFGIGLLAAIVLIAFIFLGVLFYEILV